MWLILETGGVICGLITYVIVLTVHFGMIRIALWEGLLKGESWAYIHLLVF
jgi:hypothetical protein